MTRQDLDRHVQKQTTPHAMALFGESHFLIDRYARVLATNEGASIVRMYYDEYDFATAKAHLSQGSLFGDHNLLLIKHDKKLPKTELDTLVSLVGKNRDNIFIYCYYGEDLKGVDTAFKGVHTGSVRLYTPFANEARAILIHEGENLGVSLNAQAAIHLLECHNNDLGLACNELSKLALLNKPITLSAIDDHVYGLNEIKLETLITHIIEKKNYLNDLKKLLESGVNEIYILTSLSKFLTELYLFNTTIKMHGLVDSALVLGYKLPSFIEKERSSLAIKIAPHSYKKGIALLLDTELKMKSTGSPDQEALLVSALLKLQMFL